MFKVGDKVRLTDQAKYSGSWAGEMEVVSDSIYGAVLCRHPKRGVGSFYVTELELVPLPRRLYRKGDKVTLTVEVIADQTTSHLIAVQFSNGHTTTLVAKNLDTGTLEPAPEPPYVPKPGEKFRFKTGPSEHHWSRNCILVWMDDKSIVYDVDGYRTCNNRHSMFQTGDFKRVED